MTVLEDSIETKTNETNIKKGIIHDTKSQKTTNRCFFIIFYTGYSLFIFFQYAQRGLKVELFLGQKI